MIEIEAQFQWTINRKWYMVHRMFEAHFSKMTGDTDSVTVEPIGNGSWESNGHVPDGVMWHSLISQGRVPDILGCKCLENIKRQRFSFKGPTTGNSMWQIEWSRWRPGGLHSLSAFSIFLLCIFSWLLWAWLSITLQLAAWNVSSQKWPVYN